MDKFQGQYRIPSARLPDWNYGWAAAYFITICTAARQHFFGEIVNNQMVLNHCGRVAADCWADIPNHFSNAVLDVFIVMPNHIHGILILDSTTVIHNALPLEATAPGNPQPVCGQGSGGITGTHNPMLHQNLSRIIRWYKGHVTFEIRRDAIHRVSAANESKADHRVSAANEPTDGGGGEHNAMNGSEPDAMNRSESDAIHHGDRDAMNDRERDAIHHGDRDAINRVSTGFGWQARFWDHIIRNNESYIRISQYIATNPENWAADKFYSDANP